VMDDYSGVDDENMGEADDALFSTSFARSSSHKLLLARRRALPAFHPLHERGLGVADGPRGDLDVGRPVAAHARLSRHERLTLSSLAASLGVSRTMASAASFCEEGCEVIRWFSFGVSVRGAP
jgi:hypothetical protein